MEFDIAYYAKAAEYLKNLVPYQPEIGIILGSGLGPFADTIEDPVIVNYADIPNFLLTTNPSHKGRMIFGMVGGRHVVCMQGRFHSYEGFDFRQLALPIRVFKLLGVKAAILTNASGAVNKAYHPGDIMVISDQIKMTGASPMQGRNVEEFGPRFFDVSKMYTPELRALALEIGRGFSLTFHEGVYMFFTGPQFETPAEVRAARILGADAVGMSTVTEALTAAHCGMPLLGLSVITNMAAGVLDQPLTDEEVVETGNRVAREFSTYVTEIVRRMGEVIG